MKSLTLIAVILLTQLSQPGFGQNSSVKLPPSNVIYQDSSLVNFICKLQYHVFKRDDKYLLSVIDEDIKLSFGDAHGKEDFKKRWHPERKDSEIWPLISHMISLGGVWSNYSGNHKDIVFPYVFDMPETGELSPFDVLAITGKSVNLRQSPGLDGKVIGQLNYDVVEVLNAQSYPPFDGNLSKGAQYIGEFEWYYVRTLDKKLEGYVYWEYVWSPVGYRMFLSKRNGEWKIVCLIAGD